jgi:histidinol-phosphate aminotransferase
MKAYVPGEQPQDGGYIKLNTNENPYSPCEQVNEDIRKLVDKNSLNLYSDPCAEDLRQIIGDTYGFSIENVFAGNGSDEILTIIMRCFANENDIISFPYPSYFLYKVLSDIQGCKVREVYFSHEYTLNKEDIIKDNVKIFFLANPNSPSGTVISVKDIEDIVKDFNGIFVIDEAYVDFAEQSCLDLVKKYNNVIVLRTVSKSFSLAGIRLGYAFADKKIIQGLFKAKDSYNLNAITQCAGIAALKNIDFMYENVKKIKKTREFVSKELEKMGFFVYPSQSNFLYIEHEKISAKTIYKKLKKNKILVRYFNAPLLDTGIRVTIGTDKNMRIFLKDIAEIIK